VHNNTYNTHNHHHTNPSSTTSASTSTTRVPTTTSSVSSSTTSANPLLREVQREQDFRDLQQRRQNEIRQEEENRARTQRINQHVQQFVPIRVPHHVNQLLQHVIPPPPDIQQPSHDRPPIPHVHENYDRRPFAHTTIRNQLNERVNPARNNTDHKEQKPHQNRNKTTLSNPSDAISSDISIPVIAPPKRGSDNPLLHGLDLDTDKDMEKHNSLINLRSRFERLATEKEANDNIGRIRGFSSLYKNMLDKRRLDREHEHEHSLELSRPLTLSRPTSRPIGDINDFFSSPIEKEIKPYSSPSPSRQRYIENDLLDSLREISYDNFNNPFYLPEHIRSGSKKPDQKIDMGEEEENKLQQRAYKAEPKNDNTLLLNILSEKHRPIELTYEPDMYHPNFEERSREISNFEESKRKLKDKLDLTDNRYHIAMRNQRPVSLEIKIDNFKSLTPKEQDNKWLEMDPETRKLFRNKLNPKLVKHLGTVHANQKRKKDIEEYKKTPEYIEEERIQQIAKLNSEVAKKEKISKENPQNRQAGQAYNAAQYELFNYDRDFLENEENDLYNELETELNKAIISKNKYEKEQIIKDINDKFKKYLSHSGVSNPGGRLLNVEERLRRLKEAKARYNKINKKKPQQSQQQSRFGANIHTLESTREQTGGGGVGGGGVGGGISGEILRGP
jgi:hypothetical protein